MIRINQISLIIFVYIIRIKHFVYLCTSLTLVIKAYIQTKHRCHQYNYLTFSKKLEQDDYGNNEGLHVYTNHFKTNLDLASALYKT